MTRTASARATLGALAAVVGFLAFVEFTSGVLQGYYTPMLTDIARHLGIHDADVNWLEGAQLMLSALVVPAFAKLGDMIGHKRMLLVSTALTAAVKAKLIEDSTTKAHHINVETQKGVVQLTGFVNSNEEKARAAQLAGDVDGVVSVKNDLEIRQN